MANWEFICRNKWHLRASEISTPLEIAVETHFHVCNATKTTPVFLPVNGEASWSLPTSLLTIRWHSATRKRLLLYPQGDRSGLKKPEKDITTNINPSYHQPPSPKVSLNWSTNKIRFSFNQPNRKRWGARLVNVIKHLPEKIFLLWWHHKKGSQPRLKRHLLLMR